MVVMQGWMCCLQELLPGWAKPDVSFSLPSPTAPAFLEPQSSAFPSPGYWIFGLQLPTTTPAAPAPHHSAVC